MRLRLDLSAADVDALITSFARNTVRRITGDSLIRKIEVLHTGSSVTIDVDLAPSAASADDDR